MHLIKNNVGERFLLPAVSVFAAFPFHIWIPSIWQMKKAVWPHQDALGKWCSIKPKYLDRAITQSTNIYCFVVAAFCVVVFLQGISHWNEFHHVDKFRGAPYFRSRPIFKIPIPDRGSLRGVFIGFVTQALNCYIVSLVLCAYDVCRRGSVFVKRSRLNVERGGRAERGVAVPAFRSAPRTTRMQVSFNFNSDKFCFRCLYYHLID